jgi:ribosomal protein S18 acetylase RimI-like enzyme
VSRGVRRPFEDAGTTPITGPIQDRAPDAEEHPLDNPAWSSLTGPHARFAEGSALARRYPADVSPFVAIPSSAGPDAWDALHRLAGAATQVVLSGPASQLDSLPDDWQVSMSGEGVQLVATPALISVPDDEAVLLGDADVAEMLDLVARTQPGPFAPRTHLLGTYLGIRRGGALVAMAGERLHPPGWTEISAVCTDPAHRGQGLATRLVRAVAHGIRSRGEQPLMHAAADNVTAIRLYESIGFQLRQRRMFYALTTPERAAGE